MAATTNTNTTPSISLAQRAGAKVTQCVTSVAAEVHKVIEGCVLAAPISYKTAAEQADADMRAAYAALGIILPPKQ